MSTESDTPRIEIDVVIRPLQAADIPTADTIRRLAFGTFLALADLLSFRARLLDLAVGSTYLVAIVHTTADHADRNLDLTVCQPIRVQDGKIVEVRGHDAGQVALDAF